MKAIIPCAKKEEDLYPFTESRPTGLIKVCGRTIVERTIEILQKNGVEDIYLVTNYMEELYEEKFGEFTNVNIIHQKEVNGTASALMECDFIDEDFIVINGDVVAEEEDIGSLLEKYREDDQFATLLGTSNKDPNKFGVLSIKDDKVTRLTEKPEDPSNALINTGIYVFSSQIFKKINDSEQRDLTKVLEEVVEEEKITYELANGYWADIGSLERLRDAVKNLRQIEVSGEISDQADIHESVEVKGVLTVEDGAEIRPNTVFEGSCYVGKNAFIGPNTVVKDSSIEEESLLRSCDVDDSHLMEETVIDPSTYVENCVIAEETSIKSNTTVRESFIGPRSFIEMNNSIYGVKFVPDARTDLSEISK